MPKTESFCDIKPNDYLDEITVANLTSTLNEPINVRYAKETIPVFTGRFGSWQVSLQRLAFSSPELTRLYDRAAPGWGQTLNRLGYPSGYETLLRQALSDEVLKVDGARPRILDCGVGTGALSSALARVLPTPFKLDAIDISPRMLDLASRSLRDTALDVTLRLGDVRELPYDNNAFDLVMTSHVLEHLVDPSVALNEMVRVLKPGGLLIACITSRTALGMMVHLKWRTHRVTPEQVESWLLASGLENTRYLSFDNHSFCPRMSVACLGRKPGVAGAGDRVSTQTIKASSDSFAFPITSNKGD